MQAAAHFAQLLHHRVLIGDNPLGPFEDALALGGEADKLLPAHHDGDAQFVLEPANCGRERWLGNIAAPGGASEMTLLGESDEIVELFEIHVALLGLLRRLDAHQGNGLGVDRLLAGIFKCRRYALAESGLNPPQPPFRAFGMAHPIAGGEMAGMFVPGHAERIARNSEPVDSSGLRHPPV